jgi:hypothetical protein
MKRLNPWQILLTALVTGVVTVGTGMLLFKLQTRAPKLTYSTSETVPFSGGTAFVGIYNVDITNEGSKEVEDVVCVVRVPMATIKQHNLSVSAAISKEEGVGVGEYTVKLSGLNPSEAASISVLAESGTELPRRAEVTLRAKGVTGSEKSGNRGVFSEFISIFAALVGAFTGLAALASTFLKKKLLSLTPQFVAEATSEERHTGADQAEVFAYLCGLLGLGEDEQYYRSLTKKVSYWSESDRLSNEALSNESNSRKTKVKELLVRLVEYAEMSDDSEAIIYFNIARLSVALGDSSDRDAFLAKGMKLAPKILKRRLQLDTPSRQLLYGNETGTPAGDDAGI